MKDRSQRAPVTRRRFVAMMAAGSAALMAAPLAAATGAAPPARRRSAATAAMSEPERKEFERQRKATQDTLAVLRKHAMGPGTELGMVFRPLKSTRRGG